jgi:replicative DNA helicase
MIESAYIGLLITNPKQIDECYTITAPSDFQSNQAKRLYEIALKAFFDIGEAAVSVALYPKAISAGVESDYWWRCINNSEKYIPAQAQMLALMIKDEAVKRKLTSTFTNAQQKMADPDAKSKDIITDLESELIGLRYDLNDSRENTAIKAVFEMDALVTDLQSGAKKKIEIEMPGLTPAVDCYIPGHFIYFTAYTSSGKTAFAIDHAKRLAWAGHKVVYFTVELPRKQIAARLIANISDVSYGHIVSGSYIYKDYLLKQVSDAKNVLAGFSSNFLIYDHIRDIDKILSEVRRLRQSGHADFVVIDHLGLVHSEGKSEYERMTRISHMVQESAIKNDNIIFGLSQVSNEDAKEYNPYIISGKGSGWLGADSHVAISLHRPERSSPMANLYIQKNSMLGPLQKTPIFFSKFWTRWQTEEEFLADGGSIQDPKKCMALHKPY